MATGEQPTRGSEEPTASVSPVFGKNNVAFADPRGVAPLEAAMTLATFEPWSARHFLTPG